MDEQQPSLDVSRVVKTCRTCGKTKPLALFGTTRKAPNGEMYRAAHCAECYKKIKAEQLRKWKERNKEHSKAYHVAYFQNHRKEFADYNAKWVAANPEKAKEAKRKSRNKHKDKAKDYREQHKETLREYLFRYREENREYLREHDRKRNKQPHRKAQFNDKAKRRRAQKQTTEVEQVKLSVLMKRDGLTCYICGRKLKEKEVTMDHVIPLNRGGAHTYANIKIACQPCNSRKRDKLLEEIQAPPLILR